MFTIPHNFQDYDDDDPNIEYRKNRIKYWDALKELKKEYDIEHASNFDFDEFLNWIEEKHGFRAGTSTAGISDMYTVINQAKFIFFKLKYL